LSAKQIATKLPPSLILGEVLAMTIRTTLALVAASTVMLAAQTTWAQEDATNMADDRADVWTTVEQQWSALEKGDSKWIDQLLTEDFSGWGKSSPAPRGKTSTKMWNRFNEENNDLLAHELYPLSIVVHGDVGIVHYLYTSASRDSKGTIETSNGRYTDILVRTGDGWKFLAWHGGDDE
jgi:ketosteroid isomerase-like protein